MGKKSHYDSLIRINHKQKEWLRKNKFYQTMAGYLDFIINNHKKTWRKTEKKVRVQYAIKKKSDRSIGPAATVKTK